MNNISLSTEQLQDVCMISVIMGNEVFEKAYDSNIGYIETSSNIAKWAIDFHNKYGRMTAEDWEELLENPEKHGFPKEVMCWDDAIMWYANEKLKEWKQ